MLKGLDFMPGFILKLTKGKVLVAVCMILVPLLIFSATYLKKNSQSAISVEAKTKAQRIAFLKQFDWQVEGGSETVKDTVIPSEFDNVYKAYNNIQLAQGFDLQKHKGERVKLYNLKVNNYPQNSEYVFATLLVKNGEIIGGDIHSTELNGFMHGFKI